MQSWHELGRQWDKGLKKAEVRVTVGHFGLLEPTCVVS